MIKTLETTITKEESELLKFIKDRNISPKDAKKLFEPKPQEYTTTNIDFSENNVKFGVITDLHIGHKKYRPDILDCFSKHILKEKCEFVLIAGDICEGMSGREGHVYELTHIGASEQLKYAVSELEKITLPMYAITATGSHDGWFYTKGNAGFELGEELGNKVKDFHYLGHDEKDILLDNGLRIRLVHPGSGTAYAISYKLQKYINSITGGEKPNLIFEGHYHKAMYMFYRNIHSFEAGALEGQTIFMKKMGTSAHLGYWIVEVNVGKKGGVNSIKPQFVPFYEKSEK